MWSHQPLLPSHPHTHTHLWGDRCVCVSLSACFAKGALAYKSTVVILSIHKHTSILKRKCTVFNVRPLTNRRQTSSWAHSQGNISSCSLWMCERGNIYSHTGGGKQKSVPWKMCLFTAEEGKKIAVQHVTCDTPKVIFQESNQHVDLRRSSSRSVFRSIIFSLNVCFLFLVIFDLLSASALGVDIEKWHSNLISSGLTRAQMAVKSSFLVPSGL